MLCKTASMVPLRGAPIHLLGVALAVLSGCTQGHPAPRKVVGQFVGAYDGASRTLAMTGATPGLPPGVLALTQVTDVADGVPGSGPAGTVELVTEGGPGGLRTGAACGRADSVCAEVTVRSFFSGQELHNVYVEITGMSPASGNLGFWNTKDPAAGQPGAAQGVTSTNGALWAYPALLDAGRGALPGATAGANAATRTWYFDSLGNLPFTFTGRVMADVVTTTTTPAEAGLQANCGGAPTDLGSALSCGECGRTNTGADASGCTYLASPGVDQASSRLTFTASCTTGKQACDTGDAMAFACKDLTSDASNCGVCGNDCGGGGATCVAGVCTAAAACAAGTRCGTVCCPGGSECVTGTCILAGVLEVAVGGEHACATTATARRPTLANSGTPSVPNNVVCWGNSWWQGALQPGAVTSPHWTQAFTVPEFIDPGAALGAASGQLSAGGTLTSVANAAVGVEATQIFSWGTHWNTNAIDGAGLPSYATATGGAHFCGLERGVNQGLMSCWGDNTSGQLGTGTTDGGPPYQHHVVPLDGVAADNVDGLQVGRFLIARQVVAAGDTTCALLGAEINANLGPGQVDGTVACWGRNAAGVAGGPLGDGAYLAPHLVLLAGGGAPLTGAAAVSVGGRHGVALLVDGRLAFWGANDHGQFGGPSDGAALVTIVSPPHGPVAAVSAGQDFTCYIGADAKVYCSGVNDKGQLGDGTTTERLTPVQVLGVTGATVLSSGGVPRTGNPVHGGACALAGGHVSCWGDNSAGQVGAGTGSGFYTTARLVQMTPLPVLPAAPATPAALAVTAAGAGSVTLTWTAVPGATSYNVYYSTSSPVTTLDTKVTNAAIGGDVTGLAGGTPYFLVVTAENLGGESAVSNEVTATPDLAVPNNVFAAPGDGQVSLSWAPVPGATSYTVYWSTAPDVSKAAVDHLAATTESAPVTGLVDGTAYYFVVTASNALAPESADSAVAGPITPAAPGP